MSVTAKVTVTLIIPVKSSWSDTTTMAQIYKQAKVDAEGAISRAIHPEQWSTVYDGSILKGTKIISMKVEAIMSAEDVK